MWLLSLPCLICTSTKLHDSQTKKANALPNSWICTSTKLHDSQTDCYKYAEGVLDLYLYKITRLSNGISGASNVVGDLYLYKITRLSNASCRLYIFRRWFVPLQNYTTLKLKRHRARLYSWFVPLQNYTTLKHTTNHYSSTIGICTSTKLHDSQTVCCV